jgi:hypothetical protein
MGRAEDAYRLSGGIRPWGISLAQAQLGIAFALAAPSVRASAVPQASILTVPLEVLAVWGVAVTVGSGTLGIWAWWTGGDVNTYLAEGFIAGFLYGIPITVCAAIAVVLWG